MKIAQKSGQAFFNSLILAASFALAPGLPGPDGQFLTAAMPSRPLRARRSSAAASTPRAPRPVSFSPAASPSIQPTTSHLADSGNNIIRKINFAGEVRRRSRARWARRLAAWMAPGLRFNFPPWAAWRSTRRGMFTWRISSIAPSGRSRPAACSSTLAGVLKVAGFANGPGFAALFNRPNAVAVDGAGNVYVADTGNAVVRKVTASGRGDYAGGRARRLRHGERHRRSGALQRRTLRHRRRCGGQCLCRRCRLAQTIRKITAAGVVTTLRRHAGASAAARTGRAVPPSSAFPVTSPRTEPAMFMSPTRIIPRFAGSRPREWFRPWRVSRRERSALVRAGRALSAA